MKASRKLAIIDTETGGLNAETHSILSVAVLIWNNGAIEDEYYALICEPEIVIGEGALKVNGLNLDDIRNEGVSPLTAVNAIKNLLLKHDMRQRVRICAHNAAFDMAFMRRLYRLAGADFEKTFDFRSLCTHTGALLLEQAGVIDLPGGSASLDNLVKLWSLQLDREGGHNALADAFACADVLRKEISLVRGTR